MAQYGHNWYGTSYYGATNAFSGWYQTKEIFTDEPLKNTVDINIRATLPSATYDPTSSEVDQIAGTWTYDAAGGKIYSSSANAELYMQATCDQITIKYEQRTIAAKVTIEVTTVQPGVANIVNTYTLNTQNTTVNANATYKIDGLPFGKQQIKIKMASDSPVGANFNFKGFIARTANLIVESRARVNYDPNNPMLDSDYVKLTTTITPVSGDIYTVSAKTPDYVGDKYIQFKIYLASSDNETTPEIQYIELIAGDSNNRTDDGQWSAIFNMAQIATNAGFSFQKVEEVVWTENVPRTTTLTVRSQSSVNNTDGEWQLQKVTVPYRLNTNRIRLKEGRNNGWIDAPLIAPAAKVPYVNTVEWHGWNDISFLPPDSAGVYVKYDFLSVQKDNVLNPYMSIKNPMTQTNRNLRGSRLRNFDTNLRITLSRTNEKQTPVVDFVSLTSAMHYQQDVIKDNQEFSAVDFNNTGKGIMLDTSTIAAQFKIPAATSAPTYSLIDETKRPQDVVLYFDSEATKAVRTNQTMTMTNKVWAEAKDYSSKTKTGLRRYYQYGGGSVKFPDIDEVPMVNKFTPSLNDKLRYRYHLDSGWPQQYYTSISGDTLQSIADNYGYALSEFQSINPKLSSNNDGTLVAGQSVKIPNDTVNPDVKMYWKTTNTEVTSKSSTNSVLEGKTNVESDSVMAEVLQASTYGWVDWVSEEKKYDGTLNLNDRRLDYTPIIVTDADNSTQVEYVVVTGDTYRKIAQQFSIIEGDLRKANNATNDIEPTVGETIIIPARVVLPAIHPQAVVSDNPYEIEIVYNSVKKKDGKIIPLENVSVGNMNITYKIVTIPDVEMIRGEVAHGKDPLPHARVVEIISARSGDGMVAYNPWDETLQTGDFKLSGGYIDWSPSDNLSAEPAANSTYYVTYKAEVPDTATITFTTSYYEEGGVDRIWRSPEVKEFSGICYPGRDYVAELPVFSEWIGLPDPDVEDIKYIIEDNDIWVKTWAEERDGKWVIVGSLQDRVPKNNWFPTIKTGYYYLGKDEYYLFNEPITLTPTDADIPIAENVDFVEGKFENAAQVQEGSQNLVRNSGFEAASNGKTVYKLTF